MSVTAKSAEAELERVFSDSSRPRGEPSPFLRPPSKSPQAELRDHLRGDRPQNVEPLRLADLLKPLRHPLRVLQWNIGKGRARQEHVLAKAEEEKGGWHFIALQEACKESMEVPSLNYEKVEHAPLDSGMQPVWWYVRKDVDRSRWHTVDMSCGCDQRDVHDRLISTLKVEADIGVPVYLHNVYNWQKSLKAWCIVKRTKMPGLHLMVGDFNWHALELSGEDMSQRPDAEAKRFVQLMAPHMKLISDHSTGGTFFRPQYSPDWKDNIDFAFLSSQHMNRFLDWVPVDRVKDARADHTCFEIAIDVSVAQEEYSGPMFDSVNKDKVRSAVLERLGSDGHACKLDTEEDIDTYVATITGVLQETTAMFQKKPRWRPQAGPKPGPEVREAKKVYEEAGERYRAARKRCWDEYAADVGSPHQADAVDDAASSDDYETQSNVDHRDNDSDAEHQDDDSSSKKVRDDIIWYTRKDLDEEQGDPDSDSDDDSEDENFDGAWADASKESDDNEAFFDEYGSYQPDFQQWSASAIRRLGQIHRQYYAQDETSAFYQEWRAAEDTYRDELLLDRQKRKRQRLSRADGSELAKTWREAKNQGKGRPPAMFAQVKIQKDEFSNDDSVITRKCMDAWWPDWSTPCEVRAPDQRSPSQQQPPSHPSHPSHSSHPSHPYTASSSPLPPPPPPPPPSRKKYNISKAVTSDEVKRLLRLLKIRKAPGCDGIPNELLKMCSDILLPHLTHLFNACFRLEYFPKSWRLEKIVAIQKRQSKWTYDPADARPISLLSNLGKILEALLAKRLTEVALTHNLLPETQFGCPRRSTITALIYLLEIIWAAWARGKIVTILSLDLSGAFPRTDRPSLLDILRSKGIPDWIVNMLESFFADRQVQLSLSGHRSGFLPLNCGLPQGSPLSPILFAFFSSGLLAIDKTKFGRPREGEEIFMFSYVDDTYIIAISDSYERNNELLEDAHGHPLEWARAHKAKFSPEKYKVLHLTQWPGRLTPPTTGPAIPGLKTDQTTHQANTSGSEQKGKKRRRKPKTMRILGVWISDNLKWDEHVEQMCAKAAKMRKTFTRVAGKSWGPEVRTLRTFYYVSIRAAITYAAAAWYIDRANETMTRYAPSKALLRKIEAMQNHFLRIITGALPNTPTPFVRNELYVESLQAFMKRLGKAARANLVVGNPVMRTIRNARQAIGRLPEGRVSIRASPAEYLDERGLRLRQKAEAEDPSAMESDAKLKKAINRVADDEAQEDMAEEYAQFLEERRQREPKYKWPAVLHEESEWGPDNFDRYKGLRKQEGMILFQLRTEAIALNPFLKKLSTSTVRSPNCDWCHSDPGERPQRQTVPHVLFRCKATNCQELRRKTGGADKKSLLTDPELIPITVKWAVENLRLKSLRWWQENDWELEPEE